MAPKSRSLSNLVWVIGLVVAPSALSLTYYLATGDPSIRPLGVTREALDAFRLGHEERFEIVATVNFDPRQSGGRSQNELHQALTNIFRAKGVHVRIVMAPQTTAGTTVTYRIGPSTVGPYALSDASDGVNMAVEAYRMTVKAPND